MQLYSIKSFEKLGSHGLYDPSVMIPNYASAVLLNNLVKAYNLTKKTLPISQSIENFCLGYNDESKSFKLNYGLSILENINSENQQKVVIFGKGISKDNDVSGIMEIPNNIANSFGFDIYQIFQPSDNLSNCYVLGSCYLTYENGVNELQFVLAKSSKDTNGEDLIFSKDLSLEKMEDILLNSTEITYPEPTTDISKSILIYKFIIDIENFVNDRQLDRFFIYFYDVRNPEGLFSLSEENLFLNLIPNIIIGNQQIISMKNVELDNIKAVIQSWVDLENWVPSFEFYWTNSNVPLPDELNEFLETELGIII